jgi:hypothetical protein
MTIDPRRPHRPLLRRWLAALSLVLVAAGCEGTPVSEGYGPAAALNGSWRWVSSQDVNTQQLHTPATEGFEATLAFTATSGWDGTFTYARAGAAEVKGTFSIASEDAPGNNFVVIDTPIDFLNETAWIVAGSDSLRLNGVMEGGYASTYTRVPAP